MENESLRNSFILLIVFGFGVIWGTNETSHVVGSTVFVVGVLGLTFFTLSTDFKYINKQETGSLEPTSGLTSNKDNAKVTKDFLFKVPEILKKDIKVKPTERDQDIALIVYQAFINEELENAGGDYEGEECAIHAAAVGRTIETKRVVEILKSFAYFWNQNSVSLASGPGKLMADGISNELKYIADGIMKTTS